MLGWGMPRKQSAGILMYRFHDSRPQVLLVHPGGPFWAKKDAGAWSIPKGEFDEGEDPLDAAKREFREETGCAIDGAPIPLQPLKQRGGKLVYAWMVEGNCDPAAINSNTFTMEWPPRSGRRQEFPEVDRAGWFPINEAAAKLLTGQRGFLDELARNLMDREPQRSE
jgi:predicted NUDIX family NTP pyrophosphohydrolase